MITYVDTNKGDTNKDEKKLLYLTNPQAKALAEDMETSGMTRFIAAFVSPTPHTPPNMHWHHPRLRRRNDDDPTALFPPYLHCTMLCAAVGFHFLRLLTALAMTRSRAPPNPTAGD